MIDSNSSIVLQSNSGNNIGINTTGPNRKLDINDVSGQCLQLTYNDNNGSATVYCTFDITSLGYLTITPSGNVVTLPTLQSTTINCSTLTAANAIDITAGLMKINSSNVNSVVSIGRSGIINEIMRMEYDSSNYTSFTIGTSGDLTIAPSGNDLYITGNQHISTSLSINSSNTGSALIINDTSQPQIILENSAQQCPINLDNSGNLSINPSGLIRLVSKTSINDGTISGYDIVTIRGDCDPLGITNTFIGEHNGQLRIELLSNPNKSITIAYDQISDSGLIQAAVSGFSGKRLVLNPHGGSVNINSAISAPSYACNISESLFGKCLFLHRNNISLGCGFDINSSGYLILLPTGNKIGINGEPTKTLSIISSSTEIQNYIYTTIVGLDTIVNTCTFDYTANFDLLINNSSYNSTTTITTQKSIIIGQSLLSSLPHSSPLCIQSNSGEGGIIFHNALGPSGNQGSKTWLTYIKDNSGTDPGSFNIYNTTSSHDLVRFWEDISLQLSRIRLLNNSGLTTDIISDATNSSLVSSGNLILQNPSYTASPLVGIRKIPEVALDINHSSGQCIQMNYNNATNSSSTKINMNITSLGNMNVITTGGNITTLSNIAIGLITPISFKFGIFKDNTSCIVDSFGDLTNNGSMIISTTTSPLKRIGMGYDLTNDAGVIQCLEAGISAKPLLLNPNNGRVAIGTAIPISSKLCINRLPGEGIMRFINNNNNGTETHYTSWEFTANGNTIMKPINGLSTHTFIVGKDLFDPGLDTVTMCLESNNGLGGLLIYNDLGPSGSQGSKSWILHNNPSSHSLPGSFALHNSNAGRDTHLFTFDTSIPESKLRLSISATDYADMVCTSAGDLGILASNGRCRLYANTFLHTNTFSNPLTDPYGDSTNNGSLFIGNYTNTHRMGLGYDATYNVHVIQGMQVGITPLPISLNPAGANVGIGTVSPQKSFTVNHGSGQCLRLVYNNTTGTETTYSDFTIASNGILTINPAGSSPSVSITSNLSVSSNISAATMTLPSPSATSITFNGAVWDNSTYGNYVILPGNIVHMTVEISNTSALGTGNHAISSSNIAHPPFKEVWEPCIIYDGSTYYSNNFIIINTSGTISLQMMSATSAGTTVRANITYSRSI